MFKWVSLAKSWVEAPVEILVVYYENLRRNGRAELERICQFLDDDCYNLHTSCFLVSSQQYLRLTPLCQWIYLHSNSNLHHAYPQKHQEGSFHRQRKFLVKPEFPAWVREKVDGGIDFLSSILVQHGHKALPTQYYPYYRNQSSSSNGKQWYREFIICISQIYELQTYISWKLKDIWREYFLILLIGIIWILQTR